VKSVVQGEYPWTKPAHPLTPPPLSLSFPNVYSEEYMFKFLEEFHAKYGTINDFLMNELDMTMEQIQEVRDALLVTIPVPRAAM